MFDLYTRSTLFICQFKFKTLFNLAVSRYFSFCLNKTIITYFTPHDFKAKTCLRNFTTVSFSYFFADLSNYLRINYDRLLACVDVGILTPPGE